ncbi:MAG TPA: hypothetical protein VFH27_05080, partial [Longimicrobiaceae bacterium]|nr:hypothetical protein [Longimicrobiaceae bacterium]
TVVYRNDLSASPTGVLGVADVRAAWNSPGGLQGVADGRVSVVVMDGGDGGPTRVLRVRYPRAGVGPDATGALWVMPLGDRYDELYVSYRVRFAPGFGFVKGGKLPGLAGGLGNTGGNKPNGRDGWSARAMWVDAGRMVQYVYHPDQPGTFGEGMLWKEGGKDVHAAAGGWYTLVSRVRMNTPGRKDGIVQAWLDGSPVLDRRNLRFRDVDAFAIDQFQFSTFFGGSTPDYAAARDETIDFADFVISTTAPPGLGQ